MLANTHRRHLISNRLALATGFVLLLAQAGPFPAGELTDDGFDSKPVSTVSQQAETGKSTNSILLDLGLLLITR